MPFAFPSESAFAFGGILSERLVVRIGREYLDVLHIAGRLREFFLLFGASCRDARMLLPGAAHSRRQRADSFAVHAAEPGEIGVAPNLAPVDHLLGLERQRHHLRDAREESLPGWSRSSRWPTDCQLIPHLVELPFENRHALPYDEILSELNALVGRSFESTWKLLERLYNLDPLLNWGIAEQLIDLQNRRNRLLREEVSYGRLQALL